MIYIISMKLLNKKLKKLAYYKDYVIVDSTKDKQARIHHTYSHVVTMDDLCPPDNLLHYYECKDMDDYTFDPEKIKKHEKMYLEGHIGKVAQAAIVESYLQYIDQYGEQKNIFIVLGNKEYKYFAERLQKAFNKNFKTDINFVRTWAQCEEQGNEKIFEKDLSQKDVATLQKKLDDLLLVLKDESRKFKVVKKGKKLSSDTDDQYDYDDDDILFEFKKKKDKDKKKKKKAYGPNVEKYLKGLRF